MPKTVLIMLLKVEPEEVLVVVEVLVELVEQVVREEVTTNLNKMVHQVLQVPEVPQVQAVGMQEIVLV